MKLTRSSLIFGSSLAAILLSYTGAQAEGIWDGTIGNYDNPINWDNDLVPGPVNVVVNNGGTIEVTTNHTTNDILAGTVANGTGTWNQSAGVLTMGGGWFRLGTNATGSVGTYNLSGGTLNTVGRQNIGEITGGTGVVSVSGGTWNNNGESLAVGGNSGASAGGNGTLNLSGTGVVNANSQLWVGVGSGAVGVANISGGTINVRNWLAVGRSGGTGTLNMSGGTYNKTLNGGEASIIGASGTGTFNQTGGLFNIAAGETWIGEGSTGVWNISGGTANLQLLSLGQAANGNGTLNMRNAASGNTGNLPNGGGNQVVTAGTLRLSNNASATGTVNLDGGILAVNNVVRVNGTGTFNFNGGTLRARQNNGAFMGGLTNAFVKADGAIIDSNGFGITITQNLLTDAVSTGGGLTKNGGNLLTLTGANTYTGQTNINGGSLAFRNVSSLPGYTTATGSGAAVNIAAGAGLVVGVGGPNSFTSTDVAAIMGNTSGKFNFASGSSFGVDTTDATAANGNANDTYNLSATLTGPMGVVKSGANTLTLSASNSYTGGTAIYGGVLSIGSIANGGAASDIGASSADSANLQIGGGTLRYTGGNATTDRGFTVVNGGATIENASNLTFGGQVLSNGAGSFTKNGAGTLAITNTAGTNTLTGGNGGNGLGLVVNAGLLQLGGTSASPLAQTNVINAELIIGTVNSASSPGAAVEINGGTTSVGSYIGVGRGNGTNNAATSLTLNNNAVVTSANFAIGFSNGVANYSSSPTVNFNGTSTYTSTGVFVVGESANTGGGVSTINVNNSAVVNLTSTATNANVIGATGSAVFNQNGGSVNAVTQLTIARDAASVSSYNLNGGTLTAPNVTKGAGTGAFNFNGGVLKASGGSANFIAGVTTNVKEGGAIIDSNNSNITVATALVHNSVAAIDGGLTKQGAGTLNLTGASTYTGPTVVSSGTLLVNGSLGNTSGVTVTSGATLGGTNPGTIAGNVVINQGGNISPGNSVGTLTLASLDLQGAYNVEITANGVNDFINLGTGTLNVGSNAMVNILLSYTPSVGDSFNLVDFGTYTGSLPTFNSAPLGGGMTWDTSSFTTNGMLTVVPEPSSLLLAFAGSALLMGRRRKVA